MRDDVGRAERAGRAGRGDSESIRYKNGNVPVVLSNAEPIG